MNVPPIAPYVAGIGHKRRYRRATPRIDFLEARKLLSAGLFLHSTGERYAVAGQQAEFTLDFGDVSGAPYLDTILIDWGDGTAPTPGRIGDNPAASLRGPDLIVDAPHDAVFGTHDYAAAGVFTATTILIEHEPGKEAQITEMTTAIHVAAPNGSIKSGGPPLVIPTAPLPHADPVVAPVLDSPTTKHGRQAKVTHHPTGRHPLTKSMIRINADAKHRH